MNDSDNDIRLKHKIKIPDKIRLDYKEDFIKIKTDTFYKERYRSSDFSSPLNISY